MEIINTAISKFKQPLYELFEQNEAIKNDKFQKIAFSPVALVFISETWNFLWELSYV